MTSFKSLLLVAMMCLAFHNGSVSAFRSAFLPQKVACSMNTPCFLHPSQAADLEACAYDLMKEAVEETRLKQVPMLDGPVNPDTMEASFPGPVAWCRRRLGRFAWSTVQQQQQNLRP